MKKLLFLLSSAFALVGLQTPAFALNKTVSVTASVQTAFTPGSQCQCVVLTNAAASSGTIDYVIDGGTLVAGGTDPSATIGSELAPGQSVVINKIVGPIRVFCSGTATLKIISNDPAGQGNPASS